MNASVFHHGNKRGARGFTAGEVSEAGLTCQEFEKLHFCWDSRRKTKYDVNINVLKDAAKSLPSAVPKKSKEKVADSVKKAVPKR